MPDVSKLNLDGTSYKIKDDDARKYLVVVNNTSQDATKVNITTSDDTVELALQSDLSLLTDKRFVIIGDSYAEGYTPDSSVSTPWPTLFRNYMGLASSDCVVEYRGGAGFVANSQGKNFNDLLNDVVVTSPATVTDVLVAGGYNDINQNITNIINAINTFVTNAKSKFPNAKVHIADIAGTKSGTGIYSLHTLPIKYMQGAINAGASFISGTEYCLHDYYRSFSSDGVHPNQFGHSNIAYALINYFKGSSPQTVYEYTSIGISDSAFSSNNVSSGFAGCGVNNVIEVSNKQAVGFTNSSGINMGIADGNTLYDLGALTAGCIYGNAYNTNAISTTVRFVNSGTAYVAPANLVFKNGHLYIATRIQDANGSPIALSSVTSINIYRFSAAFNALMC